MIVRRLYAPAMATISPYQSCLSHCNAHTTVLNLLHAVIASAQLLTRTQVRHAAHGASTVANGLKNDAGKHLDAKKTDGTPSSPKTAYWRHRAITVANIHLTLCRTICHPRQYYLSLMRPGTKWFPGENCAMGRDQRSTPRSRASQSATKTRSDTLSGSISVSRCRRNEAFLRRRIHRGEKGRLSEGCWWVWSQGRRVLLKK